MKPSDADAHSISASFVAIVAIPKTKYVVNSLGYEVFFLSLSWCRPAQDHGLDTAAER